MQTSTFGSWLKVRRQALDLTQVQLARQIGCAEVTLGKIERDQRRPSKQMAELLAIALCLPDEAREAFVQFARGSAEPPAIEGHNSHPVRVASVAPQPPTNLPAPLTSFVDRVRELSEVQAKLRRSDVRLLTLVGPPGIGKTRLGIQATQTLLDHFADGVWFVTLAPITDPELVLPTIARTFDMAEAGVTPLLVRLQNHLRPKQLLLMLDNFEQVLDAVPMVSDLLKAAPQLKVIATSREALNLYGEHVYPMPALSLPPQGKAHSVEQLAQFNAIKLFVARAEAVQPHFSLNGETAQEVADICLRLDGVPLAIELAASRLRQFTLGQLRDLLKEAPLQALIGAARDVEPRQRTLRNAIQWSCDLLDVTQRETFSRLGVFAGGFATEAALTVCEQVDASILQMLADQNLIKRDTNERWVMLEMIREFAMEQLPSAACERARQRHAEYFVSLLTQDRDEFYGVMDVEQHNARAALRWLLDHKDSQAGELANFMGDYFIDISQQNEGRRMLSEVLSAGIEIAPLVHFDLLASASILAWDQHDFKAGLRYIHEALTIARALSSQQRIAFGLVMLSHIYTDMNDCAPAKEAALESLRISRDIQESGHIVGALVHLAEAELVEGDLSQAEAHFQEAYVLGQTSNLQQVVFMSLACKGLGQIALSHGEYDQALRFLREGVTRSGVVALKLLILNSLAGVMGTMPRRTTAEVCCAARIWGAVEALNEARALETPQGDRRRINALIAEARTRIHPKTFAAAWAEGRGLSLDEALALAM